MIQRHRLYIFKINSRQNVNPGQELATTLCCPGHDCWGGKLSFFSIPRFFLMETVRPGKNDFRKLSFGKFPVQKSYWSEILAGIVPVERCLVYRISFFLRYLSLWSVPCPDQGCQELVLMDYVLSGTRPIGLSLVCNLS